MLKLQGIAVSPGIAIGEAFVLGTEGFRIPNHFVLHATISSEITRLDNAIKDAAAEIMLNRDSVTNELGRKYGDIFEAQYQIVSDPKLYEEFVGLIREKAYSAEYAVSVTIRRYANVFRRLESSYLAERVNDILDIEKRLLRHLLGVHREALSTLSAPVLLLASNLTPSETANLNREFVLGFVTESGGPGGHTAIVAAALEIPAVVGVGQFLDKVSGGDKIIIDGNSGAIIIRPDEKMIEYYRKLTEETRSQAVELESLRDVPAETTDGTEIELLGNIEFPYEAAHCIQRGAEGIGLYRTEFLYLAHKNGVLPSEEEHFHAYKEVAQVMKDRYVTIRTFDLGSDKLSLGIRGEQEKNPQLGLRSIRISLRNVDFFRSQLRAILRASAFGKIRVMFPLISTLVELRNSKMILADVREELEEDGIPFDPEMQIGIMVEVPSVAIRIDQFAKEVDFFSIGTNDLVQYTLAVDRTNMEIASVYSTEDPAVLLLLKHIIDAGDRHGIPVSLCGQMSSGPMYTKLLLGLGLRSFSCAPNIIPELKQIIRGTSIAECEALAETVMEKETALDIRVYLRSLYHGEEKAREFLY